MAAKKQAPKAGKRVSAQKQLQRDAAKNTEPNPNKPLPVPEPNPAVTQESTPFRPGMTGADAPPPPKGLAANTGFTPPVTPTQPYETGKNYDNPADARPEDIAQASKGPAEAAPQPFRKRDGFPDITSESVNLRMLKDYYPQEGRFVNTIRAREGELVAFPPDEAQELLANGLACRVDDEHAGVPDEQGDVR